MPMKLALALAVVLCAVPRLAKAQDGGVEFNERCARRIASVLEGGSPSSTLFTSSNPQSMIDGILAPSTTAEVDGGFVATPFQEKFSRFVNATFNREPGLKTAEDASYYMARFVLQSGLQWKDMFVGPYRIQPGSMSDDPSSVVSDTNGLGYFRSRDWMVRYAGNEAAGYRLVSAYRIMNNVIGLHLTAAQNTDGIDAATRQSNPACSGCHFDPVFGLDYAARILSIRHGTGSSMTFTAPTDGPQTFLGGQVISDDKQFVTALVNSTNFKFWACRLVFEFLYGRDEFKCEAAVFDRCVNTFSTTGKITDAIAVVAKDPSFCQ